MENKENLKYKYNAAQLSLLQKPIGEKIFLTGLAGTGKTTVAAAWLQKLIGQRIPGDSILVLVPQKVLSGPYQESIEELTDHNGGLVTLLTSGALARRAVELFWPLVAEKAGFAHPDQPPVFLNLETTQYYMARVVRPLLDKGFFSSVVIERNRLFSQIIDNLNKSAVVGFPYTEVGERLKAAWNGEPGQLNVYDDAQTCANLFRAYCLEHNLLDFCLQVELFRQHLWSHSLCRDYFINTYSHIIADNIEEDAPFIHDTLIDWLQYAKSALLVYDEGAGYRRFLGADPNSALQLEHYCTETVTFEESVVMGKEIKALSARLSEYLATPLSDRVLLRRPDRHLEPITEGLVFMPNRFFPEMLDWVVDQIDSLINDEQVPPGEIAVLSPFLSDALRFSVINRLQLRGIPARSHRPSRSLREEPVTQCLLTLALLGHPDWLSFRPEMVPQRFDIAYMLIQAIGNLDLIRAQILADNLYKIEDGLPQLLPFDQLPGNLQERVTYSLGEKYETLRDWLSTYRKEEPEELDHYFSRLFGEILSQPGFGFHQNYSAGEISANLIDSIQNFRWAASELTIPLGLEYLLMMQDGVLAAQYIRSWAIPSEDSVLVAPAYTFLMTNKPVDIQFWLDPGSRSWVERIYQPITHPYVLSRNWPVGKVWTDVDEVATSEDALYRLVIGLLARCRKKLYLGLSTLGEQGYEQTGLLLHAFNQVLRSDQMRARR